MEIMVEFFLISEDFPADEVSAYIGIGNCKILKRGDLIFSSYNNKFIRIETHTSIEYTTGYVETISVEEPIKIMYNTLLPRKNQILECIERHELAAKFCVVINLTDNPEISLSREFIALASEFHAEIEFDSYVNYDEEGKITSKKA